MVPGCPDTLIPAGISVTIFGQLRNKRWRCAVKNGDCLNSEISPRTFSDVSFQENSKIRISQEGNIKQSHCCYPLIGSIPSSIIVELNEGINIGKTDHDTTSEDEESNTDKETEYPVSSSLCECGRQLSASKNSLSRLSSCSFCQYCNAPGPIQAITPERLENLHFQTFPSDASVPLPTLPESPTETTIAELNMALESLAKITRPVSGGSDSSRSSWTSRF